MTDKTLNLDNIDFLELQVENEDKDYNLIAYITKNGKENSVLLATFETKTLTAKRFIFNKKTKILSFNIKDFSPICSSNLRN